MKFSIVTPAHNMEPWIARTIETVLSQEGQFDIEYIIVDGASSDNTLSIAQKYIQKITDGSYSIRCNSITIKVVAQEKTGMYEAINQGFAMATGNIYAWINADDTYQPGAFQAIYTAMATFPDIQWIKGITNTVDDKWRTIRTGQCRVYRHDWLALGIYGQESYFVEQDSCFWSADLWKKGGPIPNYYQSAGDYWLWLSFARLAPLWSLDTPLSNFMKREGQISREIKKYKIEQERARPQRPFTAWSARLFFSAWSRLGSRFHPFFLKIYPFFFMQKPFEYIHIENNKATKRRARSFIV